MARVIQQFSQLVAKVFGAKVVLHDRWESVKILEVQGGILKNGRAPMEN